MRKAKKQTTAIVKHVGTQVQERSPSDLIALAIDKDLDVEKLSRLVEMQQEFQKRAAAKAFYESLAIFQRECPEIKKEKRVRYKTKDGFEVDYFYAPLQSITRQIKPALDAAGLVYRWEPDSTENGMIAITCVITHKDGHSEKTTLSGSPDDSGKKNAIQSRGSAVTYLKRYTLLGALGISTADTDVDGFYEDTKDGVKKNSSPSELFARAKSAIDRSKTPDEVFAIMSGIGKVKSFSEDQIAKLKSAANAKVDVINSEDAK